MSKKIQELALSFFLLVCSISILMGLVWLKPVIESQQLLIEETRKNQEEIMKTATETKEIITEVGFSVAVIAMTENGMIQPSEANKMLEQSIETIKARSDRLGKLAEYIDDFRINKQQRR